MAETRLSELKKSAVLMVRDLMVKHGYDPKDASDVDFVVGELTETLPEPSFQKLVRAGGES